MVVAVIASAESYEIEVVNISNQSWPLSTPYWRMAIN